MNNVSQYAFYGSLRRGMFNYDFYKRQLQYHSTKILRGFRLFALKDYPIAIKSDDSNNRLTVEIFSILDLNTEKEIHALETDAGYYFECIKIDGLNTGIYLFENNSGWPQIPGGDWVKYFEVHKISK